MTNAFEGLLQQNAHTRTLLVLMADESEVKDLTTWVGQQAAGRDDNPDVD